MEIKIVIVVVIVVAITLLYKILPFRIAGNQKPFLAFFPKYRKYISHQMTEQQVESRLSEYGFKKSSQKNGVTNFTRGYILGDLSIKLAKVKVGIRKIDKTKLEITVQAGWVAAFDTGDHWKFITELSQKLENA